MSGLFKPCKHCGVGVHIRSKACKACGKTAEEAIAETKPDLAITEQAELPPDDAQAPEFPIYNLQIIKPEETPTEKEPEVYIAMRTFSCRVGDTIAQMKEGSLISDQHAIAELLKQGQPIRPVSEAEGFMTCPCCSQTFRPSPQQLALANASSAVKPTRVA